MRRRTGADRLNHKDMSRFGIAVIAIVLALSQTVGASPPVRAAANPSGQLHQAPLTVSASRPQREVFGFVNAGNLLDPNVGYPSWNLSLLTTVAYFGLHVNSGDGQPVTINDTPWSIYHSAPFITFVNTAHANGVRVIVSINLHDFSTDPNATAK